MTENNSVGDQKSKGHGLVLYHAYGSSYSQKALLALHEKKVNFKSKLVDLRDAENFKPWFMKLNPKGEVPVMKDDSKIISDSEKIIEYLDENYSAEQPRLMPQKGVEDFQKVQEMKKMLDKVPFPIITFGCVFYPELTSNPKMSLYEKKARTELFDKRVEVIDQYAKKYPDFKNDYMAKKEKFQEFAKNLKDISIVKKSLDDLEVTFDVVEKELASHTGDKESWWLCSANFTVADILLLLVLHRLEHCGFSERFFSGDKRPHVQLYYERVQQRDSFKKTYGFGPCMLALIPASTKVALASVAGAVVVAGVAVAAAFAYKKLK